MSRLSHTLTIAAIALSLCCGVTLAQTEPAEPAAPVDEATQRKIELVLRHARPFFVEFENQYYCNAYYSVRYGRDGMRSAGKPAEDRRKDMRIPVGVYYDYANDRYGNRADLRHKKPVYESVRFEWDEDETFARTQALGGPEPGEFGFIKSARVAEIIDEDTFVLTDIAIVDEAAVTSAKNKLTGSSYSWASDKYRDLYTATRRRTADVRYPDQFDMELPSTRDLQTMYEEIVDWQFEGREKVFADERAWRGKRMVVHGLPTIVMKAGQAWSGARQQLVLVDRQGSTVTALTAAPFRKQLPAEDMPKVLEAFGVTGQQALEVFQLVNANRVIGHAPGRRLALWIAGRPLKEDLAILPASPRMVAMHVEQFGSETDADGPTDPSLTNSGPAGPAAATAPALITTLESMPEDTLGSRDRRFDALLAHRANEWWTENMKGKPLSVTATLIEARPVVRNDYGTQPPDGAVAYGRFYYTAPNADAPNRQRSVGRMELRGQTFRVYIDAYIDKDLEKKLALMPTYRPGNDPQITQITGEVFDAKFNAPSQIMIYLKDCKFDSGQ